MDSNLVKIAVGGRPSMKELCGAPGLRDFAEQLKSKTAERAVLYATGIEAVGEGSIRPEPNAGYAEFHAILPQIAALDQFDPNVEIMPKDVAETALDALRYATEDLEYSEKVDSDFFPTTVERPSFGALAILRQLGRAKVAFPREFSRKYIELVAKFNSARLNPRLVADVGGRSARIAALMEYRMKNVVNLPRYFYSSVEKPLSIPEEVVEAKLPKTSSSISASDLPNLELMRVLNPEKTRALVCDFTNASARPSLIGALATLNVGLSPEDALALEAKTPNSDGVRSKTEHDAIRYAKALVAKTRVDSKLRRAALDAAKSFATRVASNPNENFLGEFEYLPLEDWEDAFQKSPSQILGLKAHEATLFTLLEKARISYLIFGASDEWTRELARAPRFDDAQGVEAHFRFLSTVLKNQSVSDGLAREIVDQCLGLFKNDDEPSTRYLLIAALFEPYPWRDALNDVVNGYERKSVLFKKRSSDDLENEDDKDFGSVSFAQVLFPFLPEEIYSEIYDYCQVGYNSTICDPSFVKEFMTLSRTLFSEDNFKKVAVLRDYLKKRANANA